MKNSSLDRESTIAATTAYRLADALIAERNKEK
jgi:hypothetical protein